MKQKNINKNIQQEIKELNKFFEDMEKDCKLQEQKKERCNYGR